MNLNFLRRQAIISSQARKKNLPYLCELEYLESTGEQRITILYREQQGDTYRHETEQMYTKISGNQYEGNPSANWYGVNPNGVYLLGTSATSTVSASTSNYDKIVFEKTSSIPSKSTQLKVNGEIIASRDDSAVATTNVVGLFKMSANTYSCYIRKKYHKFYVNGELYFDGIPVLDYDMKPAMFDRVSGKFFYNEGSGADFKYGLKDNEGNLYTSVPYLESTGEQWIALPYRILATDTFRHETANQYTKISGTQYEGQTSAGNWYGINASGKYTIGGGVTSTFTASTTDFDNIVADSNETGLTLIVNGNIVGTRNSKSSGQKVYLFNCYNPDSSATNTLYFNFVRKKYHKFYVNNKPYFIGIPVVNSDGKPAMFDIVTKNPFYNVGSGDDFTIGE